MRINQFLLRILTIVLFSLALFPCCSFASQQKTATVSLNPKDVYRFGTVFGQIKKLYVKPVNDKELFVGAIRGMLSSLDPHSIYLDEKMLKALQAQTKGEFTGLGIEVTQEKGIVKVISPIDDTPAQKAGIKAGDYILAVDDQPLIDVPLNEAVLKMRGKKGTKVTLMVINEKDRKLRKITIKRDVIHVESVKSKMFEGGYGYVRISYFQEKTSEKLIKAIKDLQKQANNNLKGLVLDLRNNPGGILDSAIEVADTFLESRELGKNKRIVYTEGRIQLSKTQSNATRNDFLLGAPLIVLINEGSASGSEIVAGALQDHKRAIVLGQRSFGKGSVQTVFPIDKKTGVKLTTALYYTPHGRSIQAEGIKPDIIVDDLKLQKGKEEALFFWKIRELNLKGHLKNNQKKDKRLSEKDMRALAASDYQLYEALQLLKSLHILRGKY